jgi:hypothetical protein
MINIIITQIRVKLSRPSTKNLKGCSMTQKWKSVKQIRDEYFDTGTISPTSMAQLKEYLKGDNVDELCRAISLVTDARLIHLVPLMAQHLNHEDSYIRESLIGKLLGLLRLPEYAAKGLEMIEHDESAGVRDLAIRNIGAVIGSLKDKQLQNKIAKTLLHTLYNNEEDEDTRTLAYVGILKGLDIPIIKLPDCFSIVGKDYPIDEEKIEEFKKRYLKP